MKKSSGKKCCGFRFLKRRQRVANNRRFCMTRIRRMERQIQDLGNECIHMMNDLTNFRAKIQQDLTKLKDTVINLECTVEYLYDRISKMEDENKKKTKEDEDDEANSLRSSLNIPGTPSDTNSFFIKCLTPKREIGESSKILLHVSSDDDTSTSINDVDLQTTLVPRFQTSEGERVQQSPKEEQDLLMEKQWEEWMKIQEMKGSHIKVKPDDQQNTEEERKAPPVSEKQTKQKVKRAGTMKKIKTYLNDLFSPHTFSKWERLEDEE